MFEIMRNSLIPCGMYGIPGSCSLKASAAATRPKHCGNQKCISKTQTPKREVLTLRPMTSRKARSQCSHHTIKLTVMIDF